MRPDSLETPSGGGRLGRRCAIGSGTLGLEGVTPEGRQAARRVLKLFGRDFDPCWSVDHPIEFEYRTGPGKDDEGRLTVTQFSVEWGWLLKYMSEWVQLRDTPQVSGELVSSVPYALNWLWRPYMREAVGRTASYRDYHRLLGCYNLPRGRQATEEALFWTSGWGPPHQMHLHMCRFIDTFRQELVASSAELGWCEGFPRFAHQLLRGDAPFNNNGNRHSLKVHYLNADQALARDRLGNVSSDPPDHREFICDQGFNDHCDGMPWDMMLPMQWDARRTAVIPRQFPWEERTLIHPNAYNFCNVAPESPDEADDDTNQTGAGGRRLGWQVVLQPHRLGWYGCFGDAVMFLARLAFDHAVANQDLRLLIECTKIGRIALRSLVEMSHIFIHELGHLLVGRSGHCKWECCMEAAALHWTCRVEGLVGTHPVIGGPEVTVDGPITSAASVGASCFGEQHGYHCDVGRRGAAYQQAEVRLLNPCPDRRPSYSEIVATKLERLDHEKGLGW